MLAHLRTEVEPEEYRRWLSDTSYASDSGDQITVWVPTEAARRHITTAYRLHIDRALDALERSDTRIRFVVTGTDDDDEDFA